MIQRIKPNVFTPYDLVALCLAVFAFLMSAVVSQNVFERLPHLEDEVAYQFQAQVFANGDLVIPSPQARRAFWRPFIVDYGAEATKTRFSKYTPGWSLALSIGERMGQAWIINAFFSMLTVVLVYRLGKEIFNQDVGIIAAALTAFSPGALLLNGTLMAHTTALFTTTLFMYAFWRIEHGNHPLRWATVGGLSLGFMLLTRPASAVAIALPFVAWVGLRLLKKLSDAPTWRIGFQNALNLSKPFVILAVATLLVGSFTYVYNYAATGNPRENLYKLVWSYDAIGFGECCGRSGHTLEKAFRHARFDLSLAAADLFGWQLNGWTGANITPELSDYLLGESSYWKPIGLSFVLFPFGILIGLLAGVSTRRRLLQRLGLITLWTIGASLWCIAPVKWFSKEIITNPISAWLWIILGLIWLLLPLMVIVRAKVSSKTLYTGLFMAVVGIIVVFQMTYWIGSQRYTTRYFYECLTAITLLSAIPLAWLMRNTYARTAVYGALIVALAYAHFNYSIPRISVLYQFNNVSLANLDKLLEQRVGDRPILLLVNGDSGGENAVSWRAYGTYMTATSPYLDSDIVAARISTGDENTRAEVLAMFPNHQVIEILAKKTEFEFIPTRAQG